MKYRREIDGLRAIAVLPVIFFHAGLGPFNGGFVGVDVFFVISGYLITSIILAEKENGTFSLRRFYERRARRILPALYLVVGVTTLLAWWCLLPSDLKDYAESLIAVSLFVSNIFFLYESGYFDTAAELKPLLHTWSLAVEEQYYVIFPLLVMLVWRFGKRWLVGLIMVGAIASLSLAQWGAFHKPAATFFLLTSRGWELAIGAMVAFHLARDRAMAPAVRGEILSLLGLCLVGVSIFAFDKSTPFPSVLALLPTLGAALIIVFARPETFAGRLLGSRLLVAVGMVSYSAYLWHQPLLALARQRSLTALETPALWAIVCLTFGLAYLSWRWVESPFRQRSRISATFVFRAAIVFAMIYVGTGWIGHVREGFRDRIPPNLEWWSLKEKLRVQGDVCATKKQELVEGVVGCEFGDVTSDRVVYLYGDSHAQAISRELDFRLKRERRKGIRVALRDCSVVPQIVDGRKSTVDTTDCLLKWQRFVALAAARSSPIIIVSRWTYRLFPVPGEIETLGFGNRAGGVELETYREYFAKLEGTAPSLSAAAKRQALRGFLEPLVSAGLPVALVYPVPEIGWDIGKLNYHYYRTEGRPLERIAIDHDEYTARHRFVSSVFAEYEGKGGLVAIRPEAIFCDTFVPDRCVAQIDSRPFYYDDDHLSDLGARLVVDKIFDSGLPGLRMEP